MGGTFARLNLPHVIPERSNRFHIVDRPLRHVRGIGEFKFLQQGNPGTGSSGVGGIETVVLKGEPNESGVYTIMLRVPAHTQIAAHSHRDDRVATVVSGTWHIGYGDKFDESKLKALTPGSFYTEPPGRNHFAETGDEPVVVKITGSGPSSTEYVDPAQDPRTRKSN
jgi:uncharacterized RmlC-like cupin family protein